MTAEILEQTGSGSWVRQVQTDGRLELLDSDFLVRLEELLVTEVPQLMLKLVPPRVAQYCGPESS